jgi:hypothetical protein
MGLQPILAQNINIIRTSMYVYMLIGCMMGGQGTMAFMGTEASKRHGTLVSAIKQSK